MYLRRAAGRFGVREDVCREDDVSRIDRFVDRRLNDTGHVWQGVLAFPLRVEESLRHEFNRIGLILPRKIKVPACKRIPIVHDEAMPAPAGKVNWRARERDMVIVAPGVDNSVSVQPDPASIIHAIAI